MTLLLHRHRDVRDELPAASNEVPSAGHIDLKDETDAITVSDSSAAKQILESTGTLVLVPLFVKTQGSASPVFPQLGLEPNHAGLASQSLFLLEEFLQSKTRWHSKHSRAPQTIQKEFRALSNVFQSSPNKTSSTQTQNNLPISSQNNMFLRHGSNNIQKHQKPTKNEKSTSKLFHAQTGSIWFQIGFYVVPTWFLRFSIVQMVVSTNLKVTYLFSCTCNVPR